jgi:hypothetical protein
VTEILASRMAAAVEGDYVLFLIGFRINKIWKVKSWVAVFLAMPKMLRELSMNKSLGLLHYRLHLGFPGSMVVQYWRSFEHLHAYALARDKEHLPAWRDFNAAIGNNGDVGIWHETYLIGPAQSESVYVNMPRFGLGLAGEVFEAKGERANALKRLGK